MINLTQPDALVWPPAASSACLYWAYTLSSSVEWLLDFLSSVWVLFSRDTTWCHVKRFRASSAGLQGEVFKIHECGHCGLRIRAGHDHPNLQTNAFVHLCSSLSGFPLSTCVDFRTNLVCEFVNVLIGMKKESYHRKLLWCCSSRAEEE